MRGIKVISLDMFQTLVNLRSRKESVWRRILKDSYTEEKANLYNDISMKNIMKILEDKVYEVEFKELKEVFKLGYEEAFKSLEVDLDKDLCAEIFIEEHNLSEEYEDSLEFVEKIKEKYIVCLTSDADYIMIDEIVKRYPFNKIFISGEVKSYKKHPSGKIFNEIIKEFNVSPEEVLHIGDSASDIIGAQRAGMKTCWINRHDYKLKDGIAPDIKVSSLKELSNML